MMALDLRTDFPRSPFDELGGYPWVARLVDKARAHAAGTGGGYTSYPCPGDRRFLDHFALDAQEVGRLCQSGASDHEILAYVEQHAKGGPEALAAFRRQLVTPYSSFGLRLAVALARWLSAKAIRQRSPGVPLGRLVTFSLVVAAEEGHPLPA